MCPVPRLVCPVVTPGIRPYARRQCTALSIIIAWLFVCADASVYNVDETEVLVVNDPTLPGDTLTVETDLDIGPSAVHRGTYSADGH